MTESDLPPECLDDDPPQHCYTSEPTEGEASSITYLPEAGVGAEGILVFALLLLWFGITLYMISTWRPQ